MTAFILYCRASRLRVLKGFTVCAHVSVWLSLCMCVCCVFWFECGCLHVITFCISVCVALPFRRKQLKLYHKLHIPIIRFLLFFLSFFLVSFFPKYHKRPSHGYQYKYARCTNATNLLKKKPHKILLNSALCSASIIDTFSWKYNRGQNEEAWKCWLLV